MPWPTPGLLGGQDRFNALFGNPIEQRGERDRTRQLQRRVTPFLLSRTKDAVVTDLPAKTEIPTTVEMGDQQRALYESVRAAMDRKVRVAIAAKGLARSHIILLEALLRLRQVCCDPRLLKTAAAGRCEGSAKLERLMELLPSLIEDGRRILLFSSFTSMLDLIAESCDEAGIAYEKLTGKTRKRQQRIDRFQAGEVPLFLISLKAGGTGLTLTAADVVIHYDPWWNPAAERQATDRAHRIGQDKPVFVYKLITAGSVEDRICTLQASKQALLDGLFDDSGQSSGRIAADDVDALLAPLEEV
jgi:SNF2 family DNA or RNA helicase